MAASSLRKAFEAFKTKDVELARDGVDDLEIEINHFSIWLMAKEQPEETDHLVQLLLINRYLERTATMLQILQKVQPIFIKGQLSVMGFTTLAEIL